MVTLPLSARRRAFFYCLHSFLFLSVRSAKTKTPKVNRSYTVICPPFGGQPYPDGYSTMLLTYFLFKEIECNYFFVIIQLTSYSISSSPIALYCPIFSRIALTTAIPHDVKLARCYWVRRQLHPLRPFTTDERYARHTVKKEPWFKNQGSLIVGRNFINSLSEKQPLSSRYGLINFFTHIPRKASQSLAGHIDPLAFSFGSCKTVGLGDSCRSSGLSLLSEGSFSRSRVELFSRCTKSFPAGFWAASVK